MRVVVIGAGLLGVCTAYFLNRQGIEVDVLDREDSAARGASYGNGGYLQASLPDPWNAPGVFRIFSRAWLSSLAGRGDSSAFAVSTSALPGLMRWGIRFLKNANRSVFLDHLIKNMRLAKYTLTVLDELDEQEPLDYYASNKGGLIIFRDEASMTGYFDVARYAGDYGCVFEALDRDALLRTEPALADIRERLFGAVYFPDDRAGNSRLFCEQLSAAAGRRGVRFRFGESVQRIAGNSPDVVVTTNRDSVRCDAVVIAAGAWSASVARSIGIRVPIAPAKGYSISVPMDEDSIRPSHLIADMGVHAGINPMGDVLRVAGTAEFCGLRPGISAERTAYLIELLRQVYPKLAENVDVSRIDPWGGHRPLSVDGLPMIGATRVPGVYLNTGHGGLGWTQGAGSAKALADLIANADASFDLADYSLSRFG